jgi:hypothetical protein
LPPVVRSCERDCLGDRKSHQLCRL